MYENPNTDENLHAVIASLKGSSDPIEVALSVILEKIITYYDLDKYRELEKRYIADDLILLRTSNDNRKFLNLPYWLHNKLIIALNLLNRNDSPLNILDIGSGPGHFLLICKILGHRVHGIDLPLDLFDDLFEFFELPKTHHRIEAFQPLPDLGQKFDLITGHYVNFNILDQHTAWGEKEWDHFLSYLKKYVLKPDGEIEFLLNPLEGCTSGLRKEDASLIAYFESRGAEIKNRDHQIIKLRDMSAFENS